MAASISQAGRKMMISNPKTPAQKKKRIEFKKICNSALGAKTWCPLLGLRGGGRSRVGLLLLFGVALLVFELAYGRLELLHLLLELSHLLARALLQGLQLAVQPGTGLKALATCGDGEMYAHAHNATAQSHTHTHTHNRTCTHTHNRTQPNRTTALMRRVGRVCGPGWKAAASGSGWQRQRRRLAG